MVLFGGMPEQSLVSSTVEQMTQFIDDGSTPSLAATNNQENRMQKITVSELVAMKPSLDKLANTQLPAKVSYAVGKVLASIAPALHDASQDNIALYRALGEKSEDGEMVLIPEAKQAEFSTALASIMNREVEVRLHHINLESFNDTLVEPAVLIAITPLLLVG